MSEEGIAVYDDNLRIKPTITKEVFDVTGAGDTVLASLGFAISCSFNIDDSVKFANLAAGVVIGKIGSATASINEIINYESVINKSSSKKFIKDTGINAKLIECNEYTAFNIIKNASGGIASNSTFCWWAVFISQSRNWILPYKWLAKKNIFKHNLQIEGTIIR